MKIETINTIKQKIQNILKSNNVNANPQDIATTEGIFSIVLSQIEYGEQMKVNQLENDLFIKTATTKEALIRISNNRLNPIPILQATPSYGYIVFNGDIGAEIPINTELTINSLIFNTIVGDIITQKTIPINSAEYNITENKIYIKTATPHNLASGLTLSIIGCLPIEFNAENVVITCNDILTFSFTPTSIPLTTITQNGNYVINSANIKVECISSGSNTNIIQGNNVIINSEIDNIGNGFVNIYGLNGGTDDELLENYRERLLKSNQSYLGIFSKDDIINRALEINGTTRIKILECEPEVGYVTILFTRDNDINIIPNQYFIEEMKSHLVQTKQVNIENSNIIVNSPAIYSLNINLSGIIPNTINMKNAIKINITNFINNLEIGESITLTRLKNIITNTIDINDNELIDYVMTNPINDININNNEVIFVNINIS